MKKGIMILGRDEVIEHTVKKSKSLGLVTDGSLSDDLPFDMTLIILPGTRVPWDLLPAAWNFLVRWDIAVPLWVYGKLAEDVGSDEDRAATKKIVHDLRVLLYSHELLFVRRNEVGKALVNEFSKQAANGDMRLAFLRALYIVKPKACYLPTTWLRGTTQAANTNKNYGRVARRKPKGKAPKMVVVEIAPGKAVKVREGDEQKVMEMFKNKRGG